MGTHLIWEDNKNRSRFYVARCAAAVLVFLSESWTAILCVTAQFGWNLRSLFVTQVLSCSVSRCACIQYLTWWLTVSIYKSSNSIRFNQNCLKNHWTNTRLVCTHLNAFFMLNPNMVIIISRICKRFWKSKQLTRGQQLMPASFWGLNLHKWQCLLQKYVLFNGQMKYEYWLYLENLEMVTGWLKLWLYQAQDAHFEL